MDKQQFLALEELGGLTFNQRMTGLAAVTTYVEKIRQDPKFSQTDRNLCAYILKLSWQIDTLSAVNLQKLVDGMEQTSDCVAQECLLLLQWIETKWQIKNTLILKEWITCIQNKQKIAPYTTRLIKVLEAGHFDNRLERKLWYVCDCIQSLLSMQKSSDTLLALVYDPDYPEAIKQAYSVLLDLPYILTMRYGQRFSEYMLNDFSLTLYVTESTIKITDMDQSLATPLHTRWNHSLAHDIALYKQLVVQFDRYYHQFLQRALNHY